MLAFILIASSIALGGDLQKELHDRFEKACESNKFMGTVAIALNGRLVFSDACGWADAEWNVKNTADTRFRTGSVAKQFTATAVLLLHEQGKFELSDPIGKYLPDLPESWRSATIHQLLTHTSGIPTYTQGPTFERMRRLGATPKEMIDSVRGQPLDFVHGTQFKYNNTGYILLGMLIEKLSGMSYERFVQENVFDRVGMKDSGFDEQHKIIPRRARGYSLIKGTLQNADFLDTTGAWSAGGFYTTVNDLILWSEALAHGKLLEPESTRRMFLVYPETVLQGMHYGYGVVLAERFGHALQYHGGGITGFQSVLQRYPELSLVIAVLSNEDSGDDSEVVAPWTLGDGLAQIWFAQNQR
ncbi:MAG TPA: serine hydrolase domain-containing protein [Candidatus Sulfotelmatobacter sp.]|nr:serine hydrolase domain-containing protein [Candidatus Sulfotelmatobacter sp.]